MARTKRIDSHINTRVNSASTDNLTKMTDADGKIWIETHKGNWLSLVDYERNEQKARLMYEKYNITQMTVPKLKDKLKELDMSINGRKMELVKRLQITLFGDDL